MRSDGVLAALQAVLVATRANEHRELSSGGAVLRSARLALTMARLGRCDSGASGCSLSVPVSVRWRAIRLHNIATDNCAEEKVRLLRAVREALKHRAAPAQIRRAMAALARGLGFNNNYTINSNTRAVRIQVVPVQHAAKERCLICIEAYEIGQQMALCATSEGGCGNYFHEDCLQRWLNYKDDHQRKRCPLCRRGMRQ